MPPSNLLRNRLRLRSQRILRSYPDATEWMDRHKTRSVPGFAKRPSVAFDRREDKAHRLIALPHCAGKEDS